MESKNERIKKIFPGILGMADELYPVYMPVDDYGCSDLDNTTLFGYRMECFTFSAARLCYIAVFRKLFLTVFLMLVRDGLVNTDLTDIMDTEVDTFGNIICLDRLDDQSGLMDKLIQKVFDAYGYHHETSSYHMDDLTDGIYDIISTDNAIAEMEANCSLVMNENDYMHINVFNLFNQSYDTEWYMQEDIKIHRFSNRWLSEIMKINYDMASGSVRMIMDNIFRLDYLLFPDVVSYGAGEYNKATGKYEFAAIESAYVSTDWRGYNEYWCRLDSAFLNFGALLTVPYIDALMDDADLCG